jgi:hypothetical protein
MGDALEALERACEEIEALEAIFGYDEGAFTVHSESALAAARTVVDDGAAALPEGWRAPQLDIELQLKLELEEADADDSDGPTARLRCAMPPGYPALCCVSVSVSVEGLRRGAADALSARLSEKAAVRKTIRPFLEVLYSNPNVYQDRLGTEIGKFIMKRRFAQDVRLEFDDPALVLGKKTRLFAMPFYTKN